MMDINLIIANNINNALKKVGKKQCDLASELGYSKQVISNMLSGSRIVSAIDLKNIAKYCGVSMDELVKLPDEPVKKDVIRVFMGQVKSEEAKKGIELADKLIDMYVFHSRVYESSINGMEEKSSL